MNFVTNDFTSPNKKELYSLLLFKTMVLYIYGTLIYNGKSMILWKKVWYYGKKYGTLGKKYGTILKSMKFRSTKENTWYIIKTGETLSNTGKKYGNIPKQIKFLKNI